MEPAIVVIGGISVLAAVMIASIFIPVGECVSYASGSTAGGCNPIQPWATLLPVAILIGLSLGLAMLVLAYLRNARTSNP
jgi:hypothetical protein